MGVAAFQMSRVTNAEVFSPGYVENSLVEVEIMPLGFCIGDQAVVSRAHSIYLDSPAVIRQPSAL